MQPPFLPGELAAASSLPKNESTRPQFAKARELTVPEIGDIVNEFAGAAQRIRAAGFDGTELNGATNHPPQQLPVPSVEKAAGFDEITDAGLVIVTKEGEREIIKADTIVTAMQCGQILSF